MTTSPTSPSRQAAKTDLSQSSAETRALLPRVDVFEDENGINLYADLAGVSKDKLDLKVDGDTLLIEGDITGLTPQALEAVHAEVRFPRYRRAFTLSRELDAARIEARLVDGVLNLRIPKQDHARPRRIDVQFG